MRPRTLIRRFVVPACLYYAVFVGLWSLVGDSYGHLFRTAASTVFRHCAAGGRVEFRALKHSTVLWDSELVLVNTGEGAEGVQPFGARYIGYASASLLLCLILATPIPWRRRLQAVLLGLVAVHLWTALALYLMVLDGFSSDNVLALYDLSSAIKTSLSFATHIASKSTVARYSVPTLIWIAVAIRTQDLAKFVAPVEA